MAILAAPTVPLDTMPNTTQLLQMLDRWLDYLSLCATLPITAPVCRPLWENVMYASAAIGGLLAAWFIWKFIDHRLQYAAALRAQAERERVADAATMREHQWAEAGDIAADVTDPHLARKIRQELEQRRAQNVRG